MRTVDPLRGARILHPASCVLPYDAGRQDEGRKEGRKDAMLGAWGLAVWGVGLGGLGTRGGGGQRSGRVNVSIGAGFGGRLVEGEGAWERG